MSLKSSNKIQFFRGPKSCFLGGKTIFHGSVHSNNLKCPDCKSRNVIRFGHLFRTFQMPPVGHNKVELLVQIPRLQCKKCGAVKQPRLAFADPKKHYTRSLERFVVDLCRMATIQDVAALTGLSWDTVKEIHKKYLRRKTKSFNLKKVRHIAIDEVYLGKKRKFMTLVLDL